MKIPTVSSTLAELEGPAAALSIVDELALPNYHPYHAVRADLLRRLDRAAEAAEDATTSAVESLSEEDVRQQLAEELAALSGAEWMTESEP